MNLLSRRVFREKSCKSHQHAATELRHRKRPSVIVPPSVKCLVVSDRASDQAARRLSFVWPAVASKSEHLFCRLPRLGHVSGRLLLR